MIDNILFLSTDFVLMNVRVMSDCFCYVVLIKPEEERRRQEELRLQQQQNNNETNLSKKSVTNVSHTHHTHYNFKDTESDTGMLYPSLAEIIHQLFFTKILYGDMFQHSHNAIFERNFQESSFKSLYAIIDFVCL